MTHRISPFVGFTVAFTTCAAVAAAPKILYQGSSQFNKIEVLEDEQGLRTLTFGNGVRQSVVKLGDPDHLELRYTPAMLAPLALVDEPRRVLIVGLGGGTIPTFLHMHYPQTAIDVVDIDPEVVAVAKRFFGFREDAMMRAHVQDGRKFIQECRVPYDVIFLDAFGPDSTPFQLTTREFFQAVRRALTSKGIVVGNIFSEGINPLYGSMVRTYQDVFREVYVLDVAGTGNKILIGLPWQLSSPQRQFRLDNLVRRGREISKQKQFRFDLGELFKSGFHPVTAIDPATHVLTDKDKP